MKEERKWQEGKKWAVGKDSKRKVMAVPNLSTVPYLFIYFCCPSYMGDSGQLTVFLLLMCRLQQIALRGV